MPQFVAALSTVLRTVFMAMTGSLAAANVLTSITQIFLLNVALGAISKLLTTTPRYNAPAINLTARGTIENRHLVFGRRRAAGLLAFYGVSDVNNRYLWYVIVVAGHQVSRVGDVWLDAVQVSDPNINPSTGLVSGARIYSFSGSLTNGSNIITNVAVPSNLVVGGLLTDAGGKIPANTTITAVGAAGDNTITMSHAATGTVAIPETITYTLPGGPQSTWGNKLYVWRYAGTSAQTVDPHLQAAFGAWDTDHTLKGCAYVVLRMERDDAVYTTGAPQNICALVDGAPVYDARYDSTNGGVGTQRMNDPSTWVFSRNPAWIIRWFLTGGSVHNDQSTRLVKYGMRDLDSRIDDPFFIAAANICDEVLAGTATPPYGQCVRYTCDIEVTTGETRRDILNAMLASMAGSLVYVHGKWRLYAGAYDSPTHTLTQDDLYGEMEVQDTSPHTQRYNQVAATYIDAANQWIQQTTIFRTDPDYETQDGEPIQREIDLRGVTDRFQAQRLSEIELRKSRMMRIVKLHGALNLLAIAQNETFTFSHARYGWTNRIFRCAEREFAFGQEAGQVIITGQREDPAVYTDLQTEDYLTGTSFTDSFQSDGPDSPGTLDYSVSPSLINFVVGLPAYLQLGAIIELWEHSAASPFGSASKILEARSNMFSVAKADQVVRYYWVRVRQPDGSVSGTMPALNGMPAAAGAPAGAGPPGPAAVVIDLSRPFISVLAYADGTVMSIAQAEGQLTVFEGTADVTASCTLSAVAVNCTGTINTAANTPVAGKPAGYYRVTAITADAATLSFTAVYGTQTLHKDFNLARVKSGIEIVTSLPATNLFEGRTVYLTTDDKLYRYNGTSWVTAVAATDISGQLADSQIAALAAAKVTGTLTDAQIQSISAAKIAGTLTASQILASGQGSCVSDDPYCSDPSAWKVWSWGNIPTFAAEAASIAGNTVAWSPSGQGTRSMVGVRGIPVNASKSYRVSCYVRQSGCNGTFYLRVSLRNASNTEVGEVNSLVEGIAVPNDSAWHKYGGIFSSAQPLMAPGVILNYGGTAGWMECQDLRIEEALPGDLIAAGTVTAANIAAGTITAAQIAAQTITGALIAVDTITAANIAAGAVTASELAAGAVIAGKIAAGAVSTAELAAGSIIASKIAAGAITANEIAASSITGDRLTAGTITAAKIAANTITAASGVLADACITAAKIGDLEVNTAKIANLTVLTGKIADNAVTDSVIALYPGTLNSSGPAWTYPINFTYMSSGGDVVIWFKSLCTANSGSDWNGLFYVDGVLLDSLLLRGGQYLPVSQRWDSIYGYRKMGAGTHTIQIAQVWNGSIGQIVLILYEMKK